MKEVKIHLDENGHVQDIHFDGEREGTVINSFVLLTSVPADPPAIHILTYGNSDTVGRMLLSYYNQCVREHPEQAFVLEQVARGIIGIAEAARKTWPGEEIGPKVVQ